MKTTIKLLLVFTAALLGFLACCIGLNAATIAAYDSVVDLATNGVKHYTFIDPASGQSVVVAVTMTAYSSSNASPVFTPLDFSDTGPTHMGVDSGLNSGDGNWVDFFEGANFSASLVSASSGVTAGTVRFGITGIGIRDNGPMLSWNSSVTTTSFVANTESVYALDSATTSLNGSTYYAQLRTLSENQYQMSDLSSPGSSIQFRATFTAGGTVADARTNSWLTTYSSQYARVYTNDTMKNAGTTLTTWGNSSLTQTLPSYCGVQEVYSSSNWVYLRTTGLGSHIMGPWYLDSNHNRLFPNLPVNQKVLWRFPRTNGVPATKTATGGGTIGYFVDGVAFFNSWDAYFWDTTHQYDTNTGSGYWNRDAYINEGVSFDAGYAHQEQTGTHHYHADPIALRYQLGDHVNFNSTTNAYSESTNTPTKHSPILAWTADGYPLYGPYGYSDATNANSGIRRMVSGYVLRDGNYGTSNLTANGRKTIPAWSARLFNVSSNQLGPNVQGQYTLGRYMEDNDYLGDHGYVQGTDFDLDEYNGRFCVTPEFPGGTYAYFVAITANGTPAFPYNIGRGFRGNPVGSTISAITESVTTNFLGNTNAISTMNSPVAKNGAVTLTWSAIEGGTYQVEATTNLSAWTTLATGVSPNQITGGYTNITSMDKRFYRAGRTGIASFDSPGVTLFGTAVAAPGGSATRGQTVIMTITLPTTPPNPPANAPSPTVTLAGSISGSNISRPTTNTVTATFVIPSNSVTGAQDVVVMFSPMPTYTLTGGFTINP